MECWVVIMTVLSTSPSCYVSMVSLLLGKHSKHTDTSVIQTINTPEHMDNTVVELKNQIEFLKKQLDKAEDHWGFTANSRIDTLLTHWLKWSQLRSSPHTNIRSILSTIYSISNRIKKLNVDNYKHDGLTTQPKSENKRIPVPEHVEPEPKSEAS